MLLLGFMLVSLALVVGVTILRPEYDILLDESKDRCKDQLNGMVWTKYVMHQICAANVAFIATSWVKYDARTEGQRVFKGRWDVVMVPNPPSLVPSPVLNQNQGERGEGVGERGEEWGQDLGGNGRRSREWGEGLGESRAQNLLFLQRYRHIILKLD